MHNADLLTRLPYGPAALLINEVCEHTPDRIVVAKHWSLDDPWISAHFRGGPHMVPGVFMAEQVAQAALLLVTMTDDGDQPQLYTLGHLRADFVLPARAPCSVVADVRLTGTARGMAGFMGECTVDGTVVARIKGVAAPAPALP